MDDLLDRLLTLAGQADTLEGLNDAFLASLEPYGFSAVSYQLIREAFDSLSYEDSLVLSTFPQLWTETYQSKAYYKTDPVLRRSLLETLPFHWFDMERENALTEKQSEFFEDLRQAGFTDGLCVPVFGPFATAGCFAFGVNQGRIDLSAAQLRDLQFACQQIHSRSFDLRRHAPPPVLSEREREVLHWTAQGKSNGVIAEILGVSDHTVDTIMRRIFAKLDVTNRTKAVLKAVGTGLVSA